jgi:hypothetical protein
MYHACLQDRIDIHPLGDNIHRAGTRVPRLHPSLLYSFLNHVPCLLCAKDLFHKKTATSFTVAFFSPCTEENSCINHLRNASAFDAFWIFEPVMIFRSNDFYAIF